MSTVTDAWLNGSRETPSNRNVEYSVSTAE